MQKNQYVHRAIVFGFTAFLFFLLPMSTNAKEYLSKKVLEQQLGDNIDQLESIIPVMEKSKAIEIALPFFNRYPSYTEKLLGDATLYFPVIEKILRQHQLPEDLKYIPFFESGFREKAVSRAGAQGMWQFMEDTGRRFGLTINREIDERMDYVKATEAAARFLKSMYEEFGDWSLVLMAYNGGPYRVKRLIRESNTSDIRTIMNQMPQESKTYLSKMIAAKLVFENYKHYQLVPQFPDPINFYSVNITYVAGIDLLAISKEHNVDYNLLRSVNPHFKFRKIRNSHQNTVNVRIPVFGENTNLRQQAFYVSTPERLKQIAISLGISARKIELANQYYAHKDLTGKIIYMLVPETQYMRLEKEFGHPALSFLSPDMKSIQSEKIRSMKFLPTVALKNPMAHLKVYFLKPAESLIDVAEKFNISLTKLKEINPGLDLYRTSRLLIPDTDLLQPMIADRS